MTQMVTAGLVPTWTIGDRLRKAREQAGLQGIELAAELGISRHSVTNYELGKTEPRRPVLVAWSMRTGVDLRWLQTGEVAVPGPRDGAEVLTYDENTLTSDQKVRGSNPFGCTSG